MENPTRKRKRNVPSPVLAEIANPTKNEARHKCLIAFSRKNEMNCQSANEDIAVKSARLPFVMIEGRTGEIRRNPMMISGDEYSAKRIATRYEPSQSNPKSASRPSVQL